jgi:hypothetical protein
VDAREPAPTATQRLLRARTAALIAMLKRPKGATIAEIVEVTG